MFFMGRNLNFLISLILIIIFSIPMICIGLIILITSKSTPFYWSKRVGVNNEVFLMPKFRTMKLDTPQVATHLLQDPKPYFLPFGKFLRKFSLDELPQLISIFKGDMSFVGSRPALYNQDDLIKLRVSKGLDKLKPGLTGWAQVKTRYGSSIDDSLIKLQYDLYYIKHRSVFLDFNIAIKTLSTILYYRGQ